MSSPFDRKEWLGARVITCGTATCLGWVKAVAISPNESDEFTIVVIPTRFLWLPKSITGAYEFSSNAVSVAGNDCLIVAGNADIRITPQSDLSKKLAKAFKQTSIAALLLIAIFPILLLTPVLALFLIVWVIRKIYEKVLVRRFVRDRPGYSNWDQRDEGDEGFSRVRQPKPPGPQPPDSIELELPLIANAQDREAFPVTRLSPCSLRPPPTQAKTASL